MADREAEEFREELMDCLYAIQRQLEAISGMLSAMPQNIAYEQGYKPFPAIPKNSKTPSIAEEL